MEIVAAWAVPRPLDLRPEYTGVNKLKKAEPAETG